LRKKIPISELEFRIFSGNEISKDFLEEQFLNLSLFTTAQNIFIFHAELIPIEVVNFIYSKLDKGLDAHLVLFFTKTNKALSDVLKKSESTILEIEPFKPWESEKHLIFLATELKINLPIEIKNWILENVEHDSGRFFEVLTAIQINFDESLITIADLKNLIERDRFDFFDLIDIYHQDRKKFLITVSRKSFDFDWFRQFSSSMQGHLVKLIHLEETLKKEKLNKYEQNLISWEKKSPKIVFKNDLKFFSDVEILSKSRDILLKDKIRSEILK
jgi:hypothetical protein